MFWGNVFILNLMLPAAMLIMGILHLRKPPKVINWLYGYCTRRSTKSQEAWEFAQRYFGSVCCIRGIIVCLAVCLLMLLIVEKGEEIIRVAGSLIGVVEGIIMISAFISTELMLKKRFGV